MQASLLAFRNGIGAIRDYIRGAQLETQLVAHPIGDDCPFASIVPLMRFQEHVVRSVVGRRRLHYNSVIVSLYGVFEHFIDELIEAFIGRLNAVIPRYVDLPKALIETHFDRSLTLLGRLQDFRYRGVVTAPEIIGRLHSCMNGPDPYRMNSKAFAHHESNYRVQPIDEAFSRICISGVCNCIKQVEPMKTLLAGRFPGDNLANRPNEFLFSELNDLADRRNEVAHGAVTAELLSNDVLLDRVDFVETFGNCLFDVVWSNCLGYVKTCLGTVLGNPIAVYDNRIVCFTLQNIGVFEGDTLIAETHDGALPFRSGSIQEIQVAHRRLSGVLPFESVDVGMSVQFRATAGQTFALIRKADWPF